MSNYLQFKDGSELHYDVAFDTEETLQVKPSAAAQHTGNCGF